MQNEQRVKDVHIIRSVKFNKGLSLSYFLKQQSTIYTVWEEQFDLFKNPLVSGEPPEPVILSSKVSFSFVVGFLLVCTVKFRTVDVSLQRLSLVSHMNFSFSASDDQATHP